VNGSARSNVTTSNGTSGGGDGGVHRRRRARAWPFRDYDSEASSSGFAGSASRDGGRGGGNGGGSRGGWGGGSWGGIVPDKHHLSRRRQLSGDTGEDTLPVGSCRCPHAHTIDGHASSFPYLLFMLFSGVVVRSIITLLPWHPPYTVLMGLVGLVVSAVKTNTVRL
jgi:hypothetical protein